MKKEYKKEDEEGNIEFIDEICYEVRFNYYWSNTIGILISFLIIFINMILKNCVVAMVVWVGDESVSKQRSLMVKAIFFTQFINTSILLLIANANLTEHQPKFLT